MERFAALLRGMPDFASSPVDSETKSILIEGGNSSADWSRVCFSASTDPSLIRDTVFRGDVKVHLKEGEITHSVLSGCTIEGPAVIRHCGLLSGYAVLGGSVLEHCGTLCWSGPPSALASMMQLGEETGLRSVPILPTMSHSDAFRMATAGGRAEALAAAGKASAFPVCGTIGPDATVKNAILVENTIIMQGSVLDCPGPVRGSVLLPGAYAGNGAQLHSGVLQWRARADTMALVTDSIVGEGSVVERHGMLAGSFLGADSVLGGGEMTASLVGPLTGMHHQSLLIATLWPGGKGNVGYGANAGSNHTSRLPDQELRMGEGFFIGLGTSIKFPADYSGSPHSILATGLVALPQRVAFPFSLICQPAVRPDGVPEGYNRLIPGWMIRENLYALVRNAWKYRNRSRAMHTVVDTSILSDEVVGLTRSALERLANHSCGEMPGRGKNFILEEDRLGGIEAYETLLEGADLFSRLTSGGLESGPAERLDEILEVLLSGVSGSREKDLVRGRSVIEDYAGVRPPAEDDIFMRDLETHIRDLRLRLGRLRENA